MDLGFTIHSFPGCLHGACPPQMVLIIGHFERDVALRAWVRGKSESERMDRSRGKSYIEDKMAHGTTEEVSVTLLLFLID